MTVTSERIAGGLVLRVLLPLAAGFFLSSFFRSLNAVLSPYLIADLDLSARSLGLLTAVYFFTSAVFQAPLGLLMDRYGPRRVQSTLLAVAAVGTVMFALGHDTWVLVAGRAIMGIGAAGALMTSFQAVVLWFPRSRWPVLNGWVMAAGGLGALTASLPAALLLHVTTWRGLLLIAAAVSVGLCVAVLAIVPEHEESRPHGIGEQLRSLGRIYRDRLFWRLAPVAMTISASNLAFSGLWSGPWLKDVGGFGPDGIAVSLLFLTTFTTAGYVGTGAIASWLGRRGVRLTWVIGSAILASMLLQLPLLLPSTAGRWVVMFAIGAFNGASALSYPVLNAHFPASLSGRVSTALNFCFFVGGFLIQYAIGVIISLFPQTAPGTYPASAYQTAFGAMILIEFLSWLWFLIPAQPPISAGPAAAPET
ncbi:MAG TPA: MFS transporter [Stellaceae bacterium]|nr:MFS transporter [Stellaceae bacterium]